jgi:hypothetical protein
MVNAAKGKTAGGTRNSDMAISRMPPTHNQQGAGGGFGQSQGSRILDKAAR